MLTSPKMYKSLNYILRLFLTLDDKIWKVDKSCTSMTMFCIQFCQTIISIQNHNLSISDSLGRYDDCTSNCSANCYQRILVDDRMMMMLAQWAVLVVPRSNPDGKLFSWCIRRWNRGTKACIMSYRYRGIGRQLIKQNPPGD